MSAFRDASAQMPIVREPHDPPAEHAAREAARAGALCLRAIRWAHSYPDSQGVYLVLVYEHARDAFGWAGEVLRLEGREP